MLKASPKYKDKALNISGYGDTGENIGKVEKIYNDQRKLVHLSEN